MEYYVVNVFSEHGIRGGNQLGVVLDLEQQLSEQDMQVIAKQFNYSESTFITSLEKDGADVRIFLPNREIDFAGHPTIGTAFVISKLMPEMGNNIVLRLKRGNIDIRKDGDLFTMIPFIPEVKKRYEDIDEIIQYLGIDEKDVLVDQFYSITASDLPFVFIPVKKAKVLETMTPDLEGIKAFLAEDRADPYVFALEGIDGGNIHARFFAPNSGIVEDPATGSAQAPLGLAMHLYFPERFDGDYKFVTEQGYEMGRPSKLHNSVKTTGGKLYAAETGGYNYLVAKGELFV